MIYAIGMIGMSEGWCLDCDFLIIDKYMFKKKFTKKVLKSENIINSIIKGSIFVPTVPVLLPVRSAHRSFFFKAIAYFILSTGHLSSYN